MAPLQVGLEQTRDDNHGRSTHVQLWSILDPWYCSHIKLSFWFRHQWIAE